MENRFLLACTCGRQLTIDPGQAGQLLTCACGQKVQAPGTLQELRRLPRAKAEESEAAPAGSWGELPRNLFGCGTLLLIFGLIVVGYFGYHLATLPSIKQTDHVHLHSHDDVDQLSPAQLLDQWREAAKGLPEDRQKPIWMLLQEIAGQFVALIVIGGFVAVVGIVTCVAASWIASSAQPGTEK